MDDAVKARSALKSLEKQGVLTLDDAAVISKDADGKIQTHGEVSKDTTTGAVVGGLLGLLLVFMFPIAGIAIGAAGGALVGHAFDRHVDKKFVQDVQAALKPGTSALFVLIRSGNAAAAMGALRPFKGTLIQTTLNEELEEELRDALKVGLTEQISGGSWPSVSSAPADVGALLLCLPASPFQPCHLLLPRQPGWKQSTLCSAAVDIILPQQCQRRSVFELIEQFGSDA